jgi:hypothetical protein
MSDSLATTASVLPLPVPPIGILSVASELGADLYGNFLTAFDRRRATRFRRSRRRP